MSAAEYGFADGQMERLPALAADLVFSGFGVDVIVTEANPNTVAAINATTTIPIVMTNSVDPVSAGLVASLARPGGNVTGFSSDTGGEINGKRLELLKETLPNLSRVGILFNPDVTSVQPAGVHAGGRPGAAYGSLLPVEARGPDSLEQALATMMGEQMQAFVSCWEIRCCLTAAARLQKWL